MPGLAELLNPPPGTALEGRSLYPETPMLQRLQNINRNLGPGPELQASLQERVRDLFSRRPGMLSRAMADPVYSQMLQDSALAGLTVYHGTQRVKNWMDNPKLLEKMKAGEDLPAGPASSTQPIDLKATLGGMKLMDGLGPHVGSAKAANARLAQYHGLNQRNAWTKPRPELTNANILAFDLQPQKPFVKKDGTPYSEVDLQNRLASIAEHLGFNRSDLRHYSSRYAPSQTFIKAQKAVRKYLVDQGYDTIPYINAHEASGSTSWIVLDLEKLKPGFGIK